MLYNLIQKKIGLKPVSSLLSFSSPYVIKDMCFAEKYGFFFVADNRIIHINNDKDINFKWSGGDIGEEYGTLTSSRFSCPSAIYYVPETEILIVAERNGEYLRKIELQRDYTSPLFSNNVKENIYKYFSKTKTCDKAGVCCFNNKAYWVSKLVHRCFSTIDGRNLLIGNGYAGYSVSGELENNLLSFPSDICSNKDAIFICDTGNQCIRKLSRDKLEYYAGPYNGIPFKNPTVIMADRNDRTIYVKDGDEVVAITSIEKKVQSHPVYKGNVVTMDLDNKNLYMIGEENA